jgi:prolipoprotein diacylglyceryl transferase
LLQLSIPSPPISWAAFAIGPLTIHIYALCILAGIVAALIITQRRMSRRGAEKGIVLDIIIWAVPLGIVGARFYHVLTHTGDYFAPHDNLWNVFAIWDGGNALYGSLIGGTVGAIIGCRRHGIRLWAFADALAPAMLVAQSIGRLGNWFNHELFGLPTTLPWGLQIPLPNAAIENAEKAGIVANNLPADTLFHPLFLYEIIWNLIGVVIILLLERRINLHWGRTFGVYLIWYGLGRSWLEAIRIDPTSDRILGLPDNVFASFVTIALGIALIVIQTVRHSGVEPSVYREGFVPKPGRGPVVPVAVATVEETVEETTDETTGADEAPPADQTETTSGATTH